MASSQPLPRDLLRRQDRALGARDKKRLVDRGNDAAQADAEPATHLRFGRELRGKTELRRDLRERAEHRHRAAGVDAPVPDFPGTPPENRGNESRFAGRTVVGRKVRLAGHETFEARPKGDVSRAASPEEEVAGDSRRGERAVQERERRGADSAGDDRYARTPLES